MVKCLTAMALDPRKWHKCDETMSHQLTACTVYPGQVHPFPPDALPEHLRTSMPGLSEAYVSGYCSTSAFDGFTAAGEFAVARVDADTAKGYNYAFGISSDQQVYYAGPCKTFDEHHWSTSEAIPVEKLFGHVEHYYSSGNSTKDP